METPDEPLYDMTELPKWREFFISLQVPDESELFRVLDQKRRIEPVRKPERDYLYHYYNTFLCEISSAALTFPISYYMFKYFQENKRAVKNTTRLSKYIRNTLIIGAPALNLFIYALTQRYFNKLKSEDELKIKYGRDIRLLTTKKSLEERKSNP